MASPGKHVGFGMIIVASMQVSASAATPPRHSPNPVPHPSAPARHVVPAPAYIRDRIDQLGRAFNGHVSIAVQSIDEGWETGRKDRELYPQQSVSKLWVAVTALDAVDHGRVSLNDKVTLKKADLTQIVAEQMALRG